MMYYTIMMYYIVYLKSLINFSRQSNGLKKSLLRASKRFIATLII